MGFKKMCELATLCAVLVIVVVVDGQRVAPGVPPQHYQQPPPPQHQVPIQQQHIPMQQQQHIPMQQQQHVPMQQQQHIPVQQQQHIPVQQQQHVPVQQQQHVPVQQQQLHHGHHPQGQPLLNTANIAQEKQHIQEHMEVPIDTSKMSEQELQFHYFKMHDADNNNKLDGSELIKSLIHWHEQGHRDPNNPTPQGEKIFTDEELLQLIDPILNMDDTNRDGYIDYPEFVRAQHKAAAGHNKQP